MQSIQAILGGVAGAVAALIAAGLYRSGTSSATQPIAATQQIVTSGQAIRPPLDQSAVDRAHRLERDRYAQKFISESTDTVCAGSAKEKINVAIGAVEGEGARVVAIECKEIK